MSPHGGRGVRMSFVCGPVCVGVGVWLPQSLCVWLVPRSGTGCCFYMSTEYLFASCLGFWVHFIASVKDFTAESRSHQLKDRLLEGRPHFGTVQNRKGTQSCFFVCCKQSPSSRCSWVCSPYDGEGSVLVVGTPELSAICISTRVAMPNPFLRGFHEICAQTPQV